MLSDKVEASWPCKGKDAASYVPNCLPSLAKQAELGVQNGFSVGPCRIQNEGNLPLLYALQFNVALGA